MFDVNKAARKCIANRKSYTPNKPPDAVMKSLGIDECIDLATNENPHAISEIVFNAIVKEACTNTNHYPESTCYELVQRIAGRLCVNNENIFVGNGLDGVITFLGMTFIDPGDEVVIATPTFPAYENITQKMDGTVVNVALNSRYELDVENVLGAITERTKLVFVCNPNNPTGLIISKNRFDQLINQIPQNVLLVSDEAFHEFVDDPVYPQTIGYLRNHPNLIVLRSFSKTMALAGLRIGYAVASSEIISMMMKAREPFPVNGIAQAAGLAVLSDEEFIRSSLEENRRLKMKLYAALDQLDVKYLPSQTNFVMVDLGAPARPVWQAMFDQGVVVRLLEEMDVPNGLRICIGKEKDLSRAVCVLAKALGKPAPDW